MGLNESRGYMNIPYVDIAKQNIQIKDQLLRAAEKVIDHGQLINGPEVKILEESLANYLGVNNVIGVSNGTAALYLTMRGLGIGPGDEVITVANSYLATVSSIVLTGATPVLIDVDDSMNMNPNLIEPAISSKTKAILVVHLTGKPAALSDIEYISKRYGLFLIEDAAQAIGAEYNSRKVGGFGVAGCFSFHPLKNLAALGDGGFISTNDYELAQWLRKARNHGHPNRDECDFWSFNMRLDTLQAAFLIEKLSLLEANTVERIKLATTYRNRLKGTDITLPSENPYEKSVYHIFMIRSKKRDDLQAYLKTHGVEAKIHYPKPIHRLKSAEFTNLIYTNLEKTEEFSREILSLPIHPCLNTGSINDICDHILEKIEK